MTQLERQELRLRSKAIPLVVDNDPVTVLYEDDRLVAVAKPAYVKVHPAHRFIGGTLVNRLIGHLGGAEPGRTHQLRVHLRSVGLPIVGDDLYGRERALYASIDELRAASAVPERAQVIDGVAVRAGLKLHAWRLHVPASVLSGGGKSGGGTVAATATVAGIDAAAGANAAAGSDAVAAAGVVITAPPPAEMVACAAHYGVAMPRVEGGEAAGER
ncbi:hypothetical protein I4F81_009668 [Pyropia yezoensis]|uniref:Uncharacterized protein n=1 Tax=Pyropia yezoensis TaxID=2788 RepID=A0ACC3CB30_PYRYE|nr:hypothetical protein I4F81_009668 [Neopyropia yezoensis]